MLIDVIDNLDAFARLREDWDATYDADPEAQFFLSWMWMSKWLPMVSGPWFILAARPAAGAGHVAFFPLRMRLKEHAKGGFYNEISMAGNFAADYTGFVCRPGYAEAAIDAFARQLKRLNWRRINLDNIRASKERTQVFLSHFPGRQFETTFAKRINEQDNINNCICPYIALPDDWDRYLAANLSANMRQKLRRFLRQIEADPSFRITHAQADSIEHDLKLLLRFWAAKWGPRKGGRLRNLVDSNFSMLRRCAENGNLFLPVLWRDDRPLGALASLIDPQKKSVLFYMAGRDESFNDPPPGLVLHAHSIRHVIGQGYTTYDFLRGNEPYKYSFGTKEATIACIIIGTRNGRNLGDKLDRGSLAAVFDRSAKLHKAGDLVKAERGYRQILDTDPRHPQALYCLGQLLAARGKHGAAKRLFTTLTEVKPESEKAWAWLARSLEARQRFAEAADAYRKIIALNPTAATAHNKLGNVLFKLRRFQEAVAAFDAALELEPAHTEADISRANTLHMLGALPPDRHDHYAVKNAELGDSVRQSGDTAFAIHCYRQAIAMNPDLVQAHYGLGLALQAQGDMENARLSYRKAADLDPDYLDVADLLFALSPPRGQSQQPAYTERP